MILSSSIEPLKINKNKQMKYYIIAGEASGDLHGANLMKSFVQRRFQCRHPVLGRRLDAKSGWYFGQTLPGFGFYGVCRSVVSLENHFEQHQNLQERHQ